MRGAAFPICRNNGSNRNAPSQAGGAVRGTAFPICRNNGSNRNAWTVHRTVSPPYINNKEFTNHVDV